MRVSMPILFALLLPVMLLPGMARAQQLFDPIADVLQHPRCMNCHTVTDFPRQTDDRIRHRQRVVRGEDNHGAPTLQCSACHQDHNVADGAVPGAPHWGLAPLSMGWEKLTRSELCEALLDKSKNGNRSVDDLVHHMTEDALVLWGWEPGGGRTTPPLEHPDFVTALNAWAAAGAPCP